jgi:hypothetical protein
MTKLLEAWILGSTPQFGNPVTQRAVVGKFRTPDMGKGPGLFA